MESIKIPEPGFEGSKNITGVLEREHIVESVRLLKAIAPGVKKIAAVFDDAAMWEPVMVRMREEIGQLPDVQIVAWDTIRTYAEYQRKIKEYPGSVDAIALMGVFNFKDAGGKNVPYQEVLKWTAENSTLPDLSFWVDRVNHGRLLGHRVRTRAGSCRGNMARAILVDGKSPSERKRATVKGAPAISRPGRQPSASR